MFKFLNPKLGKHIDIKNIFTLIYLKTCKNEKDEMLEITQ